MGKKRHFEGSKTEIFLCVLENEVSIISYKIPKIIS